MKPSYFVAAIYLRGNQLDPSFISTIIGVQPWRSQKKGELVGKAKPIVARIGIWSFRAQKKQCAIKDQVDQLLEIVQKPQLPLTDIEGVDDAYLDFFFTRADDERSTIEFSLTKEQIKEMGQLSLSVHFTAYTYPANTPNVIKK